MEERSLRVVEAKVLDWDKVVSEFERQSHHCITFGLIFLEMVSLTTNYGLNITTTVLQQGLL